MTAADFFWLALGIASLVLAFAVAYVCLRLGRVLDRSLATLGKVEAQLDSAQVPVTGMLTHLGSVTANVDSMVGRVNKITEVAEKAAGAVAKTADAAQNAVTPAVVNVAGIVAGISQGAKAFFNYRRRGQGFDDRGL
ncbi:MAG: DUF948 domain-containing protein [Candidatus Eremiobacteraeota bacterium]|nr:DUF948 domain-containing protein [Candidatus Eremiobacteraeota bacterium]MBC5826882.1 DUF948 domain-containing protein [Candidatus Eremiobacteraeota bacterium]